MQLKNLVLIVPLTFFMAASLVSQTTQPSSGLQEIEVEEVQEEETQGPPRSFDGLPDTWTFGASANGSYVIGNDVDGGGDLDVAITNLSIDASGPGWIASQLRFSLNYQHRFYDFDFGNTEPFFGTDGDQNVEFRSLGANASLLQAFDKNWGAFAIAGVRGSSEVDADLADGITWNVFTGIGYRASSDFQIGLGVGFLGRLEEDLLIIPIIQMRWQFAEDWLFNLQGRGLEVLWTPYEDWSFSLGARFASRRFRLNDDAVTSSGIFEDRRVPLTFTATHNIDERWTVEASVGYDLFRSIVVEDDDGNNRRTFDVDTSFFFGLGVRATF